MGGETRRDRSRTPAAIAVLVALLAAACGGATTPAPAATSQPAAATQAVATAAPTATPAPAPITIAQGHQGSSSDAAVYIAIERGYFKEQGLNVELTRFNSLQDQVPLLASGQVFVGSGGINAGLFNAFAQGIGMKIVANKIYYPPDFRGSGWLVRTDLFDSGKVKDAKDIKGLTVGVNVNSVQATELDALLTSAGLTFKDITPKNVAYADMAAAFTNKSVDVAFAFEPFTSNVIRAGVAKMWKVSGELVKDHEGALIAFSQVFIDKHPDRAKGWAVAYLKGVRDYVKAYASGQPPDDIVAAIVKYGDQKDPKIVKAAVPIRVNPDGYNFRASLQADLDYFKRAGFVTANVDLDKAIDKTFVDHAISVLGKYKP